MAARGEGAQDRSDVAAVTRAGQCDSTLCSGNRVECPRCFLTVIAQL